MFALPLYLGIRVVSDDSLLFHPLTKGAASAALAGAISPFAPSSRPGWSDTGLPTMEIPQQGERRINRNLTFCALIRAGTQKEHGCSCSSELFIGFSKHCFVLLSDYAMVIRQTRQYAAPFAATVIDIIRCPYQTVVSVSSGILMLPCLNSQL